MKNLGVIGISSRRHGADALAPFTLPREGLPERLMQLKQEIGVRELVYLATCNRVELAFRTDGVTPLEAYRPRVFSALRARDPKPGEAERAMRIWGADGAVEHVFLVASGFDSAQVGEHEVRSQLREAILLARESGTSGPLLDHVFDSALRVASRIHERTRRSDLHTSLGDVAVDHIIEHLQTHGGRAALVGVSPMTRRAARRLSESSLPFIVVNRTLARAEELAREYGCEAMGLEEFRERPAPVEAALLAVATEKPVLGRPELERLAARAPSGHPPLVIDMGIPANVDPEGAREADVPCLDMKAIAEEAEASRALRLHELAAARVLVDRGFDEFRRSFAEKMMAPILAGLNHRYRETAERGVERLFDKELKTLPPEMRDAVGRWAEVLARRFAHIPMKGLRSLASEMGTDAVRTFLLGAGQDDLLPSENGEEYFETADSLAEPERS